METNCEHSKNNDLLCNCHKRNSLATSNVCKYNFALEKKTNILNIVNDEIDLS